jgi:hypothetical protein
MHRELERSVLVTTGPEIGPKTNGDGRLRPTPSLAKTAWLQGFSKWS